jgi:hypothetical protein
MQRIRGRQRRSLAFEALEGRLVLSTGTAITSAVPHVAVLKSQTQKTLQASFKGRVQFPSATQLAVTSLNGKIGKDRFTGSGTGSAAGTQFLGGDVFLSNSHGSVHLSLGPAITVRAGKHPKQKVPIQVVESTGKYASFLGITGTLTTWNVPARQNALATFGGTLKT